MNGHHALTPDAGGQGMTSQRARDRLVSTLRSEGIKDTRVLEVLRTLPRHLFIDEALAARAYENTALPIGFGQTISQPWIVARMTEALLESGAPAKVLEIGTGSGYQAAVLARLVSTVYSVERIEELLRQARRRFRALKLDNIRTRHDDGMLGWSAEAPYDAIIITAAGELPPAELLVQLAPGGIVLGPFGPPSEQRLLRFRADAGGHLQREDLGAVSFVPLLSGTR